MPSNQSLSMSDSAPDLPLETASTVQISLEAAGVLKSFYYYLTKCSHFYFIFFRTKKSKTIGSLGKIRPVLPLFVHHDMLKRHNSMDSISNMSIGDVSGALNEKSSDPKKRLDFYPDMSHGALSIADVGGTRVIG
jgi:hypothetical protein